MKHRILTRLFAVAVLAVSLTAAKPASAATIQLGFILDRSGSIGATDWGIIVTGLANAINLIPFGGPDTYEVSVVSFATSATTVVNRALITDAASRTAAANLVSADLFTGGNTNFQAAFSQMQTVLTSGGTFTPGTSYVNFATDGVPTVGTNGVTERNNLINAGIDNISIEAIGSGVDATFLQQSICYPLTCDLTLPFDTFPTVGFYIGVADATAYANAIGAKVLVVTGQVPEPTSVVLLGTGLLFAAHRLRRRKA